MKRLFILLFVCIVCSNMVFPHGEIHGWMGNWKNEVGSDRSLCYKIPFTSEYWDDIIIIYNSNPNKSITYEILNEYGNVFITGSVSKENSAQITISVSDLPDNGIYTIILTSPNPNDRVWSQFEK